MLELGLFPMTWLFPERRRIVPLGSTLPFSLTRRMFGATPLSPAEVPGTMVASTRVAFAGTSTSTLMRETFWTVAPEAEPGKAMGPGWMVTSKVSPAPMDSGASTMTEPDCDCVVGPATADGVARQLVPKVVVTGAADAGIPARMTPLASAVAAIGAAMRRLEYTNMDSPELGTGVVSKADVGD